LPSFETFKTQNIMKKILMVLAAVIALSCSKDKDPCEGVTCSNGGTCLSGKCDCTEGYEGERCTKQKTPTKIKITKITVTKFPATTDNGNSWDLSDGPDVLWVLSKGNVLIDYSDKEFENQTVVPFTFNLTTPVEITDVTATYTLLLVDDDDPLDPDQLGGVNFTLYDSNNKFPSELELKPTNGNTAFNLTLSYVF
jgi:hypothetical protein